MDAYSLDNKIEQIINEFSNYLNTIKFINKINITGNFIKNQEYILITIKSFFESSSESSNINDILKRYCLYYAYSLIAFHYSKDKSLFAKNIIDTNTYDNDKIYKINNFFNSNSNSNIMELYDNIKYIQSFVIIKNMTKILEIIKTETNKYNKINLLFNSLDEKFISALIAENNYHDIIKLLIMYYIYIYKEKKDILNNIHEKILQI